MDLTAALVQAFVRQALDRGAALPPATSAHDVLDGVMTDNAAATDVLCRQLGVIPTTSRQHTGVNGLHAVALMAVNLGRTGQLTDAERRDLTAALVDLAYGFASIMQRPGGSL